MNGPTIVYGIDHTIFIRIPVLCGSLSGEVDYCGFNWSIVYEIIAYITRNNDITPHGRDKSKVDNVLI